MFDGKPNHFPSPNLEKKCKSGKKNLCESVSFFGSAANLPHTQGAFRENIEIDLEHKHRLLSVDSVAHQFMYKEIFNIVFPNLAVYHDSGELKSGISLKVDNSYSRSNSSHEVFKKTWGWSWGYRNTNLRSEFNLTFPKYVDKIQDKLFNMNINDGPKRIVDFK